MLNNQLILNFSPRFLCFFGVWLLLALEQTKAATEAPCIYKSLKWSWLDRKQGLLLQTCEPDIEVVSDEKFVISSLRNDSNSAFKIDSKRGVQFLPTNLFDVLPNLVLIKIRQCSVKSINGNHFKNLPKLKFLELSDNKIGSVDSKAFADLVSLEVLDLSFNQIQSLDESTFKVLKALKHLQLNNNNIQTLHPKLFGSLSNIEEIRLDFNKIDHLDESIFKNLANLKVIALNDNKLTRIQRLLFRNNSNLTEIVLRNNKIEIFQGDVFERLSKLVIVDLLQNSCVNGNFSPKNFVMMKKTLKTNCKANFSVEKTTIKIGSLKTTKQNEPQTADPLQQDFNATTPTTAQTEKENYEVLVIRAEFSAVTSQASSFFISVNNSLGVIFLHLIAFSMLF